MKRNLTKKEPLFVIKDGKKIVITNKNLSELFGDCVNIHGNCSNLYGKCSLALCGSCSHLSGDCTGIKGYCTGLSLNLDDYEITDEEREKGIDINKLVKQECNV